MDDNLNEFFVIIDIYQDDKKIHSVTTPKSLIHEMFNLWKYPGSPYEIKVIDHTGNFRINSVILNQ